MQTTLRAECGALVLYNHALPGNVEYLDGSDGPQGKGACASWAVSSAG